MRIAIGADHRGFTSKGQLVELLRQWGHTVDDVGTHSPEPCDYPDFAAAVGQRVGGGNADRGILVCGSGIGICIAANKVAGVRAGVCHDMHEAEMSRRHNDLNVLCLSEDMFAKVPMEDFLRLWLETPFEGGRHVQRLEKIRQLEGRT
jgi:ribose 5-phosphate isomerase B